MRVRIWIPLALAAFSIVLAGPVSSLEPEEEISEPAQETEAAEPAKWTVEVFLEEFLSVDREISLARLEHARSVVATAESRDRSVASASFHAPVGYSLIAGPDVGVRHLGTASLGAASLVYEDDRGRSTRVLASSTVSTAPEVLGGNQLGLRVDYSVPLWRNAGGKLHDLKTASFLELESARKLDIDAAFLDRCVTGLSLYLRAYVLQELSSVWEDLLEHKERTLRRTERDFARRLVTRLDRLASSADWLSTRQRFEDFSTRRARNLATFFSYVPSDEEPVLASPKDLLATIPASLTEEELEELLQAHPVVQRLDREIAHLQRQRAFVERSFLPEIFLVPEVGVEHYSQAFVPGAATSVTHAFALLGLGVDWPLRSPRQDYDLQNLSILEKRIETERRELTRRLSEHVSLAEETIKGAEARLELANESLETIQNQIREATRLYNTGRLEFQDYLQHWSFYEEGRFAVLELTLARWLGQIELLRALGPTPEVCVIGGK